jgi:hypothetical protein
MWASIRKTGPQRHGEEGEEGEKEVWEGKEKGDKEIG